MHTAYLPLCIHTSYYSRSPLQSSNTLATYGKNKEKIANTLDAIAVPHSGLGHIMNTYINQSTEFNALHLLKKIQASIPHLQ